jgi:hypothetical protein
MTRPTIAQVYARHLAAFTRHTPFGILLKPDREALVKATARDAGVTVEEVLRAVIEERRRKGPGGRITIQPPLLTTIRTVPSLPRPDNSLFDTFPPLDPEDPRWIHA